MPTLTSSRFAAAVVLLAGCSSTPSSQTSGTGSGGHDTGTGGDAGTPVPCTTSGVSKGPWSLAIDGTSAKIRWEACRSGTKPEVTLAPEAGGADQTVTSVETPFVINNTYTAGFLPDAPPDLAGTYYMHEAALTGLAPATCYAYHLAADAGLKGRFCTARNPGDPLTFMAIGDTNPGIGPYAAGDIQFALPHNFDFTLHGGDIQYYASGLETWASWFPVMQPMFAQGGFFPAIGNHESEQPDEYTQYEERFFGGAGFDGTNEYYRFQSAGVWFFSIDTELDFDPGSPQGAWLAASLADASQKPGYRFSVVYFHRPLVTCGDTSDNPDARAKFEPIFAQYHVPLVLQAHMHGYERFEFPGITYLTVAGGGGRIGDINLNMDRPYCNQRVASGEYRFSVIFDVTKGQLAGTVIDYTGLTVDSFTHVVP